MDDALSARLLAPEHLMEQMAQRMDLGGARLRCATPREIDAPGYLSDLVGVTLSWDADTGVPTRAVLKMSHPGFGQGELPFYRDVAARLDCPIVPRFFAGGTDAATAVSYTHLTLPTNREV